MQCEIELYNMTRKSTFIETNNILVFKQVWNYINKRFWIHIFYEHIRRWKSYFWVQQRFASLKYCHTCMWKSVELNPWNVSKLNWMSMFFSKVWSLMSSPLFSRPEFTYIILVLALYFRYRYVSGKERN